MTKRLAIVAVALFALGFVVTACGDDDDDDKAKETTTQPADTAAAGPDTDSADEKGNQGAAPAASVKQAVENCKQSIGAQTQLSSDAKKDLQEICEEAGTGDEDGVRDAARKVCRRVVEETAPAGAARDQALKACDQAASTR